LVDLLDCFLDSHRFRRSPLPLRHLSLRSRLPESRLLFGAWLPDSRRLFGSRFPELWRGSLLFDRGGFGDWLNRLSGFC
jgi:hypothetical protein